MEINEEYERYFFDQRVMSRALIRNVPLNRFTVIQA